MKAGCEHRMPLAPAAVAVLRRMEPLRGGPDAPVFPGQRDGRPLSVMAMAMALRRMGRGDLFTKRRRSMEDWAEFCADAQSTKVTAGVRGLVKAQA